MTTTILHCEDTNRLVQIAAEYHAGWKNAAEIVVADYSPVGADIVRMVSNTAPLQFSLADDEMDELATSWLAYRADMKAQAEAEQQRQAQVIAEAYAIAARHPLIKIEEKDARDESGPIPAWHVSMPDIGWNYGMHACWAYSHDKLLEDVKDACAALQGRSETPARPGDAA